MKKCSDKKILRRITKTEDGRHKEVETFAAFQEKYDRYLRVKTGQEAHRQAARPYVEVFHQP